MGPSKSVCVIDWVFFIVNVPDLPFVSTVAIHR